MQCFRLYLQIPAFSDHVQMLQIQIVPKRNEVILLVNFESDVNSTNEMALLCFGTNNLYLQCLKIAHIFHMVSKYVMTSPQENI